MISNEQIITHAKNRWRMCGQTEALVTEIRALLIEIGVYRTTLVGVRKLLDLNVQTLRDKGGE